MATVADDVLQLPLTIKAKVGQGATAIGRGVAGATMQKTSATKTLAYFADRRRRADMQAFDQLLGRLGREAPTPDDTVPEGWWDQPSR